MKLTVKSIPGIVVCALIAGIATFLGNLKIGNISLEVVGAPVFAILIGMIVNYRDGDYVSFF